jgi:hypothetical protein
MRRFIAARWPDPAIRSDARSEEGHVMTNGNPPGNQSGPPGTPPDGGQHPPAPPGQAPPGQPTETQRSRIQHATPGFNRNPPRPASIEPEPVPVAESAGPMTAPKKITAFGKERRHEEQWNRATNVTGTGAIHVKTFHSKITADALQYLDQQINEWLDAHPEYEVKFVQNSVGVLTGKLKEPHLICQVWV